MLLTTNVAEVSSHNLFQTFFIYFNIIYLLYCYYIPLTNCKFEPSNPNSFYFITRSSIMFGTWKDTSHVNTNTTSHKLFDIFHFSKCSIYIRGKCLFISNPPKLSSSKFKVFIGKRWKLKCCWFSSLFHSVLRWVQWIM